MFAPRRRSSFLAAALLLASAAAYAQQPGYDPADPAAANMADANQPDPPQRVARISVLEGTASFEPASVNEFSPAEINFPMTNGDRLYSGDGSLAELQTGQISVRLGAATDVTLTAMTDSLAQFGLAGGSVHLRTFALDPGTTTEIDTPNAAITILEPGDIRVEVDPNSDTSWLTVISGQVQVDGSGFEQTYGPGTSLRLDGLNPLDVQNTEPAQQDGLDQFSYNRDSAFEQGQQAATAYVNTDTIGGADLAGYGDWSQDADNGAVWYPRGVAADWQPYRVGHWAWIAPWGWTWVEAEPWGFAPFHYGRWARFGPRWGWVPGPRVVRPVWAPALVVFVGGADFSASLGYRGGVAAWFPLGPREAYAPWYHTSPVYVNRINVSNIYNRDERFVRATYNQRTINVAYDAPQNRSFANRGAAVVVPQAAFAAGRSAAQNQVRLTAQQASAAPVLSHPLVTPAHEIVQPGVPRALPTHIARPVLDARERAQAPVEGQATIVRSFPGNNSGNNNSYNNNRNNGTHQGFGSIPVQGRPAQPNPTTTQQQPVPVQSRGGPVRSNSPEATGNQQTLGTIPVRGRPVEPTQTTPQQTQTQQGTANPANPRRGNQDPVVAPPPPVHTPLIVPAPTHTTPYAVTETPQPAQSTNAPGNNRRGQPEGFAPQQPAQNPAQSNDSRSLFNRASPPQPHPNFEQQRQAIETTEPGRPLSPRQMENVRQNQPANPAPQQQREPAPRPAPASPAPAQHPAPAPTAPTAHPQHDDRNPH